MIPSPCCRFSTRHLSTLGHFYQFDFDLYRCNQCSRYWVWVWREGTGDWENVTNSDADRMQALDAAELRSFMKIWAQAFN